MPSESLRSFLSDLSDRTFESAEAFEEEVIPELVAELGYRDTHLHFRVPLDATYDLIPDAMVAAGRDKRPHLLVEADFEGEGVRGAATEKLAEYKERSRADYVVLVSPTELTVIDGERHHVDLTDPDGDAVADVASALEPPESLPDEPFVEHDPATERVIDTERFHLDLDAFEDVLHTVENPSSTQEKGESLENLAGLLFDGIDATATTEQNMFTATSEVDVVARHEGVRDYTLFDEYSRYILIECKNWSKPVGAKQIRDFKGKLQASGVNLGVFFSQSGVTGGTRGEYALGELDMAFRNEGIAIVVVDANDLEWIRNGNSFYDLLERKLYTLRFRRKTPFSAVE
ncbi:restriction endonuclease [Halarchaeum sp. P4]|uniref:restriction endonuclease n=1 Tax=Halarchaeum sp. P4 TaxID=3421639 RepID=UPI003EC0B664